MVIADSVPIDEDQWNCLQTTGWKNKSVPISPLFPLPVLRLARLAVSEANRSGIGLTLLRSVFYLACEMSERVGCIGVVVDAKPDALDFYMRFGFEKLEVLQGTLADRPEPIPMFIPLSAIPV